MKQIVFKFRLYFFRTQYVLLPSILIRTYHEIAYRGTSQPQPKRSHLKKNVWKEGNYGKKDQHIYIYICVSSCIYKSCYMYKYIMYIQKTIYVYIHPLILSHMITKTNPFCINPTNPQKLPNLHNKNLPTPLLPAPQLQFPSLQETRSPELLFIEMLVVLNRKTHLLGHLIGAIASPIYPCGISLYWLFNSGINVLW